MGGGAAGEGSAVGARPHAPPTRAVELVHEGLARLAGPASTPSSTSTPTDGPRAGRTPAAKPRGAEPKPRYGKARRSRKARQKAKENGVGAPPEGWPLPPWTSEAPPAQPRFPPLKMSGASPGQPRFRPHGASVRGGAGLGRRRHEGRTRRRGVKAGPEKVCRRERREEAFSVGPRGAPYDSRLKRCCTTMPGPRRRERVRDGSSCTVTPAR